VQIGIVGNGQLGQMLRCESWKLGCDVSLSPLDLEDEEFEKFISKHDAITFELEDVPETYLQLLEDKCKNVFPAPRIVRIAADRYQEKNLLKTSGFATADVVEIQRGSDASEFKGTFPGILKTRFSGYDGKGQHRVSNITELQEICSNARVDYIFESFLTFDFETSIIAARSASGMTAFLPSTNNTHREGILLTSIPTESIPGLEQTRELVEKLLESLNYVGVLCVEFFVDGDHWIANEMAPRVHNSGHWSLDGAMLSQFDLQLMAGLGMDLFDQKIAAPVGMFNAIGEWPENFPGLNNQFFAVKRYDYNKTARPGRKLGHFNILGRNLENLEADFKKFVDL